MRDYRHVETLPIELSLTQDFCPILLRAWSLARRINFAKKPKGHNGNASMCEVHLHVDVMNRPC